MTRATLVLLPGLDGTGKLFDRFVNVIADRVRLRVVSYPADRRLGYEGLLEHVEKEIVGEEDVVLIAESFSGPIALQYAVKHPEQVRGLVLCASFVTPPIASWVRWMAWPILFRIGMPGFVMRRWMVGSGAPRELVSAVKAAVRMVDPRVMAHRVREMVRLDCREALRQCPAPILYLKGDQDFLVGTECTRVVCAEHAHVRLREIKGPHLLLQREPLAAWREIQTFLTEIVTETR